MLLSGSQGLVTDVEVFVVGGLPEVFFYPHPNRLTDLASAKDWLDRGFVFLATFPPDHSRYHHSYFQFHYYQAELHLIDGHTDLASDHYQQAHQIAFSKI